MGDYKRVITLALVMAVAILAVLTTTFGLLYNTAFEEQRARLVNMAQSSARMMKSVASFNKEHRSDYPEGAVAATISQIKKSHQEFEGFGKTGEFVIAQRDEDQIQFVLRHRFHSPEEHRTTIPFDSAVGKPIQRALSGLSGTVVIPDYRGEMVLAAYEPVEILNLGIVAKMDITEIRAPFVKAGTIVFTLAILLITIGTVLFFRLGEPLIRALRTSRERYEAIIQGHPEMLCRFAPDGTITFVNDAFCRFFGKPREELVGQTFAPLVVQEDLEVVEEKINSLSKDDPVTIIKNRVIAAGDEIRWTRWANQAIWDDEGHIIEYQSGGHDITEQVRVEDALRESELEFRLAIEKSPLPIALTKVNGDIEHLNPKFQESFGWTIDDVKTASDWWTAAYPDPEYRKRVSNSWEHAITEAAAKNEEIVVQQWKLTCKNGDVREVEFRMVPLTKDRHLIVMNDITERKYAERELERVFYLSPDFICWGNLEGYFTKINSTFEKKLGYTEAEFYEKPFLEYVHDEDVEKTKNALIEASTAKAKDVVSVANRYRSKNGSYIWIEWKALANPEENKFFAFGRDITNRKQAEMQLLAAKEEIEKVNIGLEVRVKERTQELETAKKSAEDASKSKSTFLANMSHEIRTPMNGVVGMVEVLIHMGLNPDQRRMVQTIKNSSFSLLRIIDDILDSSKIEAGKMELEHVPVHLLPVLEGLAETMMLSADDKNVRLSLFIDPAVPEWVYSDAVRLRQVLLNLASNAVKFSRQEEGGEQGMVDIRAIYNKEGKIQFTVSDNGIGMSEEVRSRLFKPFSQGEDSTTRQFGGTGLGLMISHSLVKMMGGTIEVDSVPGRGSTFTVTLPLEVAEGDSEQPDISGLEVLALVDDIMSREVLSAYVEGNGSTIRYAENKTELASLVSASKGEPIVALALVNRKENDRVLEELTNTDARLRFLIFTAHRSDKLGMIKPNSYLVQRLPVLPSETLKGLAVLAGRKSPDLDLSTPERAPSAGAPTIEEAEAQNRLILLVEDDATNQLVIKHQLNLLGYAVEIADDGKQGLEMWQTRPFNLVLTDCHMPVMDGFELTEAIREAEKQTGAPHMPIVAITANAMQGEAERCLESGMDDYLSKPVELKRLGHTLGRWLPKTPSEATKIAADESGKDRP